MVQRAQVILHAAAGKGLKEIGAKVGLSWQTCLKWRKRFLGKGIQGIADLPRSEKPLEIGPEKRVEVMALACTTSDDGSSQWSSRKLADAWQYWTKRL